MSRGNAPYRRLNQGREAFGISRGTAGFSSTVTNTIEGGTALQLTYDISTTSWGPTLNTGGRTTGVFVIQNPNGINFSTSPLTINSVTGEVEGLPATADGNTVTLWVF